MKRILLVLLLFLPHGCADETPHPNQQAIDRAEKLADHAAQQAELARQEAKHVGRLRDLDKLTFDSRSTEMQAAVSLGVLWLLAMVVLLIITLVWLAREIRLRRVLGHILCFIRDKGGAS